MNTNPDAKRRLSLFLGLVLLLLVFLFASAGPSQFVTRSVAQAAPLQQNQPVVSFSQPSDTVTEPDVNETEEVTIVVRISQAPSQEVKVDYSTAPGSAVAGVDYQPTNGTLTFPAGSNETRSFDVTVFGNSRDEPNRTFVAFLTNPSNATVGLPSSITITIVDDDEAPATNTPTATPGGPVFLDRLEPNNDFDTASTVFANAAKLTDLSLWPVGDEDFFRFFGKRGAAYEVFTTDVSPGLDTFLRVYDPEGKKIAENDDFDVANPRSQVLITANQEGFYFARVIDQNPSESTARTYSFGVNEIVPPTPTPTATRIGTLDSCENNNTVATACLIGVGETLTNMNFIPPQGTGVDSDFYRLPVKPGILYTCQTQNLSPVTDTNIIFLDGNGNDFNPQLGNDDRAPGDPSSQLSWFSTYQGDLIILVGPVNVPTYEESPRFTYDLTCTAQVATPTPVPSPTRQFVPPAVGGPGPGPVAPSPTPFLAATGSPTPTPEDGVAVTPTVVQPPVVSFQPLPTATRAAEAQQTTSVQVTIYYDSNFNFMPEQTEGILDVAVALYENTSGRLIAFGYTNDMGIVRFDAITSTGPVRVEVPFLNYRQVVTGASANILLRVEPRPLPSGVP